MIEELNRRMNQEQNTYYQQPTGQMMPPHAPKPMRQRMMNKMGALKDAFPKWLSQYPIVVYILALMVVSFMYSAHSLPWYYMLSGVVAVIVFFLYGSTIVKDTSLIKVKKEKTFEKKIFIVAFIPRVLFTILIYWIFQANYGDPFGFENGDAAYYNQLGQFVVELIRKGNFHFHDEITKWCGSDDFSDMGYGIYVGFVYWLTGSDGTVCLDGIGGDMGSILMVRLLKCLMSSWMVILVYRIAKRNFGEQTSRMAAIFCALWPNFWYYCAVHLKETEMVFLSVLFVEQADQMLRSRQFTAWKVIPVLLIAAAIFTMRIPLGMVALLALIFSVVMSSTRVVNWGKRIIVGGLTVALIGVVAGNRISEQANDLVEQVQSGRQKQNMEWRSERTDGGGIKQSFAKYAGAAVFAPMIFTLPFPSMVRPFDGQDVQQLLNGGNFVKNIISLFTIIAMIMLLMSGKWREHLLPLSFVLGYLVVLAMSEFAQSERFHQPVMPLEFMFAAYGLSIAITQPKYKRWFTYWCALMLVAAISWNWFKLAGRGLT